MYWHRPTQLISKKSLKSYIGIFFRGKLLLSSSSSSSTSSPPSHIILCCMNYDFFHAIRARHVNVDLAGVDCGFGGKRVISLYLILPCLVSVVTLLHFTSLLCPFTSLCLSCDAYCWAVCALWLAWYLLLLGSLNVYIVPTPWLTWLWEEQATNFKIAFSWWAVKGWSKAILFSLCCINYIWSHAIRAKHVDLAAVDCGFGGKRVISLYLTLPYLVSVVTLLHFTSLLCHFTFLCLSCDAYCWAVCALWLAWYLLLLGRLVLRRASHKKFQNCILIMGCQGMVEKWAFCPSRRFSEGDEIMVSRCFIFTNEISCSCTLLRPPIQTSFCSPSATLNDCATFILSHTWFSHPSH